MTAISTINPIVLVKPFTDDFMDADGNYFPVTLSYKYQFGEDDRKEITFCMFDPKPAYNYPDQELIESVKNYIELIEGVCDWNVEPRKYEPKY